MEWSLKGDLVVMTPIKQGPTENVIRVERISRVEVRLSFKPRQAELICLHRRVIPGLARL